MHSPNAARLADTVGAKLPVDAKRTVALPPPGPNRRRLGAAVALGLSLSAAYALGIATTPSLPVVLAQPAVGQRVIDLATPAGLTTIMGTPNKDELANDVASGDLNDDGLTDLVLGAHWGSEGGRNIVGRTYSLFGRPIWASLLDLANSGAQSWGFIGTGREARMGTSVAVGDLSGDGVADLVMGSLLADPPNPDKPSEVLANAGSVYVVFGGKSAGGFVDFRQTRADVVLNGRSDATGSDQLGETLAIGDFNGDRRPDLAVAAVFRTAHNVDDRAGAVFVWWGPLAPGTKQLQKESANWTILGPSKVAYLGTGLAAGDLNGDGTDDLAISAFNGGTGAPPGSGAVFVFHGRRDLAGTIDLAVTPADHVVLGRPDSLLGGALSPGTCSCRGQVLAIADLTGDGRPDLLAGAPLDNNERGSVSLVAGPLTAARYDLAEAPHLRLEGQVAKSQLGWSLRPGHLDGDGRLDLTVAAPKTVFSGRNGAGMILGLRGPLPATGTLSLTSQTAPLVVYGQQPGSGAAGITMLHADVTGDGIQEMLAGFPDDAPAGRHSVGAAFLIPGPILPTLATDTPTATETPTETSTPIPSATATASPTVPTATPTDTSEPSPTVKVIATTAVATPRPTRTVALRRPQAYLPFAYDRWRRTTISRTATPTPKPRFTSPMWNLAVDGARVTPGIPEP